jgi:hypothetical protein
MRRKLKQCRHRRRAADNLPTYRPTSYDPISKNGICARNFLVQLRNNRVAPASQSLLQFCPSRCNAAVGPREETKLKDDERTGPRQTEARFRILPSIAGRDHMGRSSAAGLKTFGECMKVIGELRPNETLLGENKRAALACIARHYPKVPFVQDGIEVAFR